MNEGSDIVKPTPIVSSSNSILDDSSIKKVIEDKQRKQLDMGPRWAEEELEIFLKYFRQSGLKELETMQAKLTEAGYKRSVNNLLAVYLKNKNFLTLNTACTAKDLSAIMADHYDAMESEFQVVSDKPPLRNLDIETESVVERRRTPSNYNYTNRGYYTDNSKLRMFEESATSKRKTSKTKKSTSEDNFDSLIIKRHTSSEVIMRDKPRKPRKSPAINGKFQTDVDFKDPDLFKNIELGFRTCSGKASRKNNHFSLRRIEDKAFSTPFLRFLDCELFYSTIDKPYFSFNEFRYVLGNINEGRKFKRSEWSFIRACMGKPRRFSNNFIRSQLEELNNYRNMVRNYLYNKTMLPESKMHPLIIQKVKELQPFQVSQVVLAINPHCSHIHPGSILTITGNHIIVKFFPNELGAVRVPDSKVLAISPEEGSQIADYFNGNRFRLTGIPMNASNSDFDLERNPSQTKILQDMDFNALSMFIKILEKKTTLVNELRNFNDVAESNPTILNEKFFQEYGWTGVQIKLLDNALKHITAKTRLRGLHNYDPEQVSENLDQLMANPLKNLIELDEKKAEDIDPQVVKEIKSLLNKNIEQKIDEQIKILSEKAASNAQNQAVKKEEDQGDTKVETKGEEMDQEDEEEGDVENQPSPGHSENLKDIIVDDVDDKKKAELKKMINNIFGVLLSLKYNGELNLTENKYLTDLFNGIYDENPNEFHEINTAIVNICSK